MACADDPLVKRPGYAQDGREETLLLGWQCHVSSAPGCSYIGAT